MSSTKTILATAALAAVAIAPTSAAICWGTSEVCAKMNQPTIYQPINPSRPCFGTAEACGLVPKMIFEDDADEEQFKLLQSIKSNARDVIQSLSHPMRRVRNDINVLDEDEEMGGMPLTQGYNGIKGKKRPPPHLSTTDPALGSTPTKPTLTIGTFDEDYEQKVQWSANAGISGQVGRRPNFNVGISAKWEEEEQKINASIGSVVRSLAHPLYRAEKASKFQALEDEELMFEALHQHFDPHQGQRRRGF